MHGTADPAARGGRRYPPPDLPPATAVGLPGRGTTSVRTVPGLPGSPALVLLHGWTANAALNWHAAFGALGERFRVAAPDLRGHGAGVRSPDRFRLEDCADDVAALADALALDRVVAVGYSMGGAVAQLLWRRHRDLVAGLVLCATAADFVGPEARGRAWHGVMTGLSYASRATPPGVRARVAARFTERRVEDTPLGRWSLAERRANDLQAMVDAGRALGSFSSAAWVGEVDVPTAVVVTEPDEVVPTARQRRLAALVPGATTVDVPGPHDVCARRPSAFVPALVAACTEVATRAGL